MRGAPAVPDRHDLEAGSPVGAMNTAVLFGGLVLVFGTGPYAIALQLGPVAPEVLVAYRFAAAGAMLIAVAVALGRSLRFGFRDHLFIALQGVLMFSAVDLLIYYAVARLPGGVILLVMSTLIMGNVGFGWLLLGLPIRPRVVVGALMGLVGIAMVSWPEVRDVELGGAAASGLAATIAAMVLASLGIIAAARNQRAGLPILETTGICMGYGAACSLLVALAFGRPFGWDFSPIFLGGFAWTVVPLTAMGFIVWLVLLSRLGADRSAYVILLTPIVALSISTADGDYTWTALAVVGVITVLAGNAVVLSKVRKAPLAPAGGP